MKSIILFFLLFGIVLCSSLEVVAQEKENLFSPEKGFMLKTSIDANPRFLGDWKVTAGWSFKETSIYGSYESFKEISFEAYYLGFLTHSEPFDVKSEFLRRISTGFGGFAGLVNKQTGMGLLVEGTFWATSRLGFGLQGILLQNNSLGGYGEIRFFITYTFF
jgi:hypothetical protein